MMLRYVAGILILLMLAALFVGGAQPQAAGLIPAPWDKLAHVIFFFVFAWLLARVMSLPIALVITLSLLVGATDEIYQSFLPGRVAGWDDWLADVVGAGLGVVRLGWQGIKHKGAE